MKFDVDRAGPAQFGSESSHTREETRYETKAWEGGIVSENEVNQVC